MRATAAMFSSLYLFVTIGVLFFSLRSTFWTGQVLFWYTVLAQVLLWSAYFVLRKKNRSNLFFAIGIVLTALFFTSPLVPNWTDQRAHQRARQVEVFDVSDEPFLGPEGAPRGIRVQYSIRVPSTGEYYALEPSLDPPDVVCCTPSSMSVVDIGIHPTPENQSQPVHCCPPVPTPTRGTYRKGITYRFTVDLVPNFIWVERSHGTTHSCFQSVDPQVVGSTKTRFRVRITSTDYGGWEGGPPQLTSNDYSLKAFYDTAAASGIKECVSQSRDKQ